MAHESITVFNYFEIFDFVIFYMIHQIDRILKNKDKCAGIQFSLGRQI